MYDLSKKPQKILIIDLLYMGDLIFATPFFRQLKRNYSEARIDIIVNSNFYELVADNPHFYNVYSYDKKWNIKESWKFAHRLKKYNYDLGINIHGNWRTILLMYLIRPDYNIGYGGDGKGFFLDTVIKTDKDIHMVKVYLQFLEKMGLKRWENDEIEISLDKQAISFVNSFLADKHCKFINRANKKKKKLIGLNTGGTWPTKRWSQKKFAKLADYIQKDGNQVVFFGGANDIKRVKNIIKMMTTQAINAAGKTSLKELVALVSKCDLVISNDSGPVHVAAAVATPTITIFGPSDEKKYRPYGDIHSIVKTDIKCRPCGKHECPLGHHNCMENIEVDDLIKVLKKVESRDLDG